MSGDNRLELKRSGEDDGVEAGRRGFKLGGSTLK